MQGFAKRSRSCRTSSRRSPNTQRRQSLQAPVASGMGILLALVLFWNRGTVRVFCSYAITQSPTSSEIALLGGGLLPTPAVEAVGTFLTAGGLVWLAASVRVPHHS